MSEPSSAREDLQDAGEKLEADTKRRLGIGAAIRVVTNLVLQVSIRIGLAKIIGGRPTLTLRRSQRTGS